MYITPYVKPEHITQTPTRNINEHQLKPNPIHLKPTHLNHPLR